MLHGLFPHRLEVFTDVKQGHWLQVLTHLKDRRCDMWIWDEQDIPDVLLRDLRSLRKVTNDQAVVLSAFPESSSYKAFNLTSPQEATWQKAKEAGFVREHSCSPAQQGGAQGNSAQTVGQRTDSPWVCFGTVPVAEPFM
mmetsp:Transcript_39267/g.61203  ORF Transcript_39267/g.61203 Transcript_39267/m.61203 type:complete len:139 (+) Transcript_39267:621-1037(+)